MRRPVKREFLTVRELEARYPRLLGAMQWAGILSRGEATACLRDYRDGYPWSGEAVNHFGGTAAVIRAAASHYARHAASDNPLSHSTSRRNVA